MAGLKQRFEARVAELGCTVTVEGDGAIYVDAKPGTRFERDMHVLMVYRGRPGSLLPMQDVYQDLLERMADGVEPCNCEGCSRAENTIRG